MTKVNENGRPCPSWCAADHSVPGVFGCVSHEVPQVRFGDFGLLWTWPRLDAAPGSAPEVRISAGDRNVPGVSVAIADTAGASRMARFLEIASSAGPEGIRALAASIREVSALVWPEPGQAAPCDAGPRSGEPEAGS